MAPTLPTHTSHSVYISPHHGLDRSGSKTMHFSDYILVENYFLVIEAGVCKSCDVQHVFMYSYLVPIF